MLNKTQIFTKKFLSLKRNFFKIPFTFYQQSSSSQYNSFSNLSRRFFNFSSKICQNSLLWSIFNGYWNCCFCFCKCFGWWKCWKGRKKT